jgi:glycosyltransferase involved in cell wall biosynthesis
VGLTVLNVAFPLAPVRPDTAGGAEQVLLQIDSALVHAGHCSIVLACEGSEIAGTLIEVPAECAPFNDHTHRRAQKRHAAAIKHALYSQRIDVVHLHGLDFHTYLPPAGPPVLITLHLPLELYPPEALIPSRPNTWLHCVSPAQHAARPRNAAFLPPISNGVVLRPAGPRNSGDFALYLGRICPEKGVHLAIEAAKRANVPLVIAGTVFPYEAHMRYFHEEIAPRLDSERRFIGSIRPAERDSLLSQARCLLLPSLIEETSSLVAREALAAGTPVIAFPRRALLEILKHGHNGFVVDCIEQMADGIAAADSINPDACRRTASQFPLARMIEEYFALYRRLARTLPRYAEAG